MIKSIVPCVQTGIKKCTNYLHHDYNGEKIQYNDINYIRVMNTMLDYLIIDDGEEENVQHENIRKMIE